LRRRWPDPSEGDQLGATLTREDDRQGRPERPKNRQILSGAVDFDKDEERGSHGHNTGRKRAIGKLHRDQEELRRVEGT
jgi:hypothetical protein